MKALAAALALLLPVGAFSQALERSSAGVEGLPPFTVTAPRERAPDAALETVRSAGAGTAVAGAGLMTYIVVAAPLGPLGWAAAAIFVGGMSAYLSHRALHGKDDFRPGPRRGEPPAGDQAPGPP